MHFGVLPPYRAGVTADPVWMTSFVQHAEALGFESVYVVEHVVVPADYEARYPYSETGRMPLPEDCPIPDPLELLAFLAAKTERIVLGTGVLVLPEHNPVILAKRLATIDVLSGGRMRLGVGVGWLREELESVGVEFETRGARMDEMIDALRVLWSEEEPTFDGRFFSFSRAISRPQPSRHSIPIHIGGHSAAAARRAGARGDGYFPLGLDSAGLSDRIAQLRTAARAADRDPDAVEISLGGLITHTGDKEIAAAEKVGASRIILSTAAAELEAIQQQMATFADRWIT